MATPQVEDGYTKIANELLEALCKCKLSSSEFRVMFFIIRYTYGFKRKTAKLAGSFISKGTELDRRRVVEVIKALTLKNMIICRKTGIEMPETGELKIVNEISIQKNYLAWIENTKTSITENRQLAGKTAKVSGKTAKASGKPPTRKKINKYKENSKNKFKEPTLEEVSNYCQERNNDIDPEYFINYNAQRGWLLKNGQPIKCWKAVIRTWETLNKKRKKENEDDDYVSFR